MEINPIILDVALVDYETRYSIKETDTIYFKPPTGSDEKHVVQKVLSNNEILTIEQQSKKYRIAYVNDLRWYIKVEVIRVCDINFKTIQQREINFDNG